LFPSWNVDISFKDDVSIALLQDFSFVVQSIERPSILSNIGLLEN
jgi:hypothetical protein